jgi:hypothetical protein
MSAYCRVVAMATTVLLAACSSSVVVEDGAGAGGAPSSVDSSSSLDTSSSTSAGGAPAEPTPVPGCEALVQVGDRILVDGINHPFFGHLALAGDDRAELIYLDHDDSIASDVAVGHLLESAFTSWPPAIGARMEIAHDPDSANSLQVREGRLDGTISLLATGFRGVMRAGEPGMVKLGGVPMLEPSPGLGGFVVEQNGEVRQFASFDPVEETVVASIPDTNCAAPATVANDGALWASASASCNTPGPGPVGLFRIQGGTVTAAASLEPEDATSGYWSAFPRDSGGIWIARVNDVGSVSLETREADGSVGPSAPQLVEVMPASEPPRVMAWRGGVAAATLWYDEDLEGAYLAVAVTDGVHRTTEIHIPAPDRQYSHPSLVASPDGRTLLITYSVFSPEEEKARVAVTRVDCVTPD